MLSFFLCNLPGMWYTAVMTERRDPMRAEERRQAIRELLQRAKQPVSATALAAQFSVSRQIIVGILPCCGRLEQTSPLRPGAT